MAPANKKLAEQARTVRRSLARLGNRVQTLSQGGMDIHLIAHFVTPEEALGLVQRIDANAAPSTLYAGTEVEGFRTSYSGNLDPTDPFVDAIDARITAAMGLDKRFGEGMQGQRYTVGQLFKPHHDYFFTDQPYWQEERVQGGQRSWTAMLYLNNVPSGGETNFNRAGLCLTPVAGTLVIWNNMDADGLPNFQAQHEGCPVHDGVKYVVTKWFRERFWVGHVRG
jgi:prolyl 4-hydroxylase